MYIDISIPAVIEIAVVIIVVAGMNTIAKIVKKGK